MTDYPHRMVEIPPKKVVRRLLEEMERRAELHKPMFRHYLALQCWLWSHELGGKIPTNLEWVSDLYYRPNEPERSNGVARALLPSFAKLINAHLKYYPETEGEDSAAFRIMRDETPLLFTLLKSFAFCDDLNWFIPSEDLLYSLLATDLVGLYPSDVFLPLPVLFIELPPNFVWSQSTRGLHEVRAVAVTEGFLRHHDRMVKFAMEGSEEIGFFEGNGRRLLMNLIREPLPDDVGLDNSSSQGFSYPLNDTGKPLDQLEREELAFMATVRSEDMGPFQDRTKRSGKILETEYCGEDFVRAVTSLVLNILLYMTTSTATKKSRHATVRKGGRHKSSASVAMRNKEWLIGTEIKISQEVKEVVRGGVRTSHKVKTLVRGFIRRQHHGPKNSLTKMVQIAPHIRNYGLPGLIQGHTYKE